MDLIPSQLPETDFHLISTDGCASSAPDWKPSIGFFRLAATVEGCECEKVFHAAPVVFKARLPFFP
jgi:hypothetical protein